MAIIYSYPYDQTITDVDAWVGTDSVNRQTKQYTARAVADYLNINGRVAIAGQMNYQFVQDPSFKGGTFAFPGGQGDNTPWSSITSIVISNMDLSGQIVSPFLEYLIDEQVMFQDVADKASFGHYIMRGYAQIGITNFYTLTLEYIGGNGSTSLDSYYTLVNFYLESAATHDVTSIDTSDTQFISMTPTSPTTGDVTITTSLSATGTPDNTKFLRGDNTWAVADLGFWELGTAPDSIFTTKMASVGQDANIVSSKFNVYKTEDMTASVPHIATFNESSSNHSANLWPSPGDNAADIYGSVSRATLTGSGTVDQIIGANPIGRHSGSGSVNFIQGVQTTANLIGSGSANTVVASYAKTFIEGTGSTNIPNAMGAWNAVALNGLNDVDNIYGTYSNVILTKGEVNDDAIGHFIDFDQVAVDTEVNNAYYIHAKNDSLSVTGEKFFIKDETGIPSQFSNKLVLNAYGSGTFTGAATQRLAVDTNGNVIEIPIGSGPVDGSGTANYAARWIDTDTLGIGTLYDNGTNIGIGTTSPDSLLEISTTDGTKNFVKLTSGAGGVNPALVFEKSAVEQGVIQYIRNGDLKIYNTDSDGGVMLSGSSATNYDMYINNSGNVGIGTTSPNRKLSVYQSSSSLVADFRSASGNNSFISFSNNASTADQVRLGSTSGDLVLSTNYTEKMRITSDGNVGIGTTSPDYLFEVEKTTSGSATLASFKNTENTGIRISRTGTSPGTSVFNVVNNGALYTSSDSHIAFQPGNSTSVFMQSTGNVGIGTTSPSNLLDVVGSNAEIIINDTSSSPKLRLRENGSTAAFIQTYLGNLDLVSSGDLNLYSNNTQRVTIKETTGNVGIGTTSPSTALHIKSTSAGGGYATIENTVHVAKLQLKSATHTGTLAMDGTGGYASGGGLILDSGTNVRTQFLQGGVSKMIINSGNVGIGTASPGYKLHIAQGEIGISNLAPSFTNAMGSIGAYNQDANNGGLIFKTIQGSTLSEKVRILANGNVGIGTTSPTKDLEIGTNAAAETEFRMHSDESGRYFNIQSAGNFTSLKAGGSQNFILDSSGSAGYITMTTNASERVRVNYNGNVGIGTTAPSEKLEVSGARSKFNGILVGENNTDIQFEGDGNLAVGNNNWLTLNEGGQEIMRAGGSSRNVGIGTTSPNAKLNVNGNVKIEGENELYFGGSGSVPGWEIKASGSDLVINDTGTNVGSVLFNNDEGIVLPRLTTTEINAISLPSTGLTVYNTTLNTLCFYNGSSWQKVSHANM